MGLFWLLWSQSALVSLPFLWGLACPTWRHRQPSRCTTAALVRGAARPRGPSAAWRGRSCETSGRGAPAPRRADAALQPLAGTGLPRVCVHCRPSAPHDTCARCVSPPSQAPRSGAPTQKGVRPIGGAPHDCTAISASQARRFGPRIWDAARRRAAMCDGLSDGRPSSAESCRHMRGPLEQGWGHVPEGSSAQAYSSRVISFPEIA